MSDENAEETYCTQCIQAIQRQAEIDMKPYVDRLVRIRSLRPSPPFHVTMTLDEWNRIASPPKDAL